MCSDPVTFGGGMTIEKTGPGAFGSALNNCSSTQYFAQCGSIWCGSYALAISRAIPAKDSCLLGSSLYDLNFYREGNLRLYEAARTRSIQRRERSITLEMICLCGKELERELGLLVELVAYDAFDYRLQQIASQLMKLFWAHTRHHFFDDGVHVDLSRSMKLFPRGFNRCGNNVAGYRARYDFNLVGSRNRSRLLDLGRWCDRRIPCRRQPG